MALFLQLGITDFAGLRLLCLLSGGSFAFGCFFQAVITGKCRLNFPMLTWYGGFSRFMGHTMRWWVVFDVYWMRFKNLFRIIVMNVVMRVAKADANIEFRAFDRVFGFDRLEFSLRCFGLNWCGQCCLHLVASRQMAGRNRLLLRFP